MPFLKCNIRALVNHDSRVDTLAEALYCHDWPSRANLRLYSNFSNGHMAMPPSMTLTSRKPAFRNTRAAS